MKLAGQICDEELSVLEKKCEELIAFAVNEGTRAKFHAVRRQLSVGRRFSIREPFLLVQAHLEERIAEARREEMRRASRRLPMVRFKNFIGL